MPSYKLIKGAYLRRLPSGLIEVHRQGAILGDLTPDELRRLEGKVQMIETVPAQEIKRRVPRVERKPKPKDVEERTPVPEPEVEATEAQPEAPAPETTEDTPDDTVDEAEGDTGEATTDEDTPPAIEEVPVIPIPRTRRKRVRRSEEAAEAKEKVEKAIYKGGGVYLLPDGTSVKGKRNIPTQWR